MIGVFDSGHGGLTILQALRQHFPDVALVYLGDHAEAPYGNHPHTDVLARTQAGVAALFDQGCTLVILGCNSATAIAAKTLQQEWLPTHYPGRNVLGIIAPTVEAATQTPWSIKTPQYPQKYNTDHILVFATALTVNSGVYPEEILKRCPQAQVIQQACPQLAGAIEAQMPTTELRDLVAEYVHTALLKTDGHPPEWAILGCTHFPLVKHLFQEALPPQTRVLDQPTVVANSLRDYLERHPEHLGAKTARKTQFFTSGDPTTVSRLSGIFLGQEVQFEAW